jgi:hypothetical protein
MMQVRIRPFHQEVNGMTEYLRDDITGDPVLDLDLVIRGKTLTRLAAATEGQAKSHKPIVITMLYTIDPDVRIYTLPVALLETQPAVMIRHGEPIEGHNITKIGRMLGRPLADTVEGLNYACLISRFAIQFNLCPSFDWVDAHEQIMAIFKDVLSRFGAVEFILK